jgi:hypothetical protein
MRPSHYTIADSVPLKEMGAEPVIADPFDEVSAQWATVFAASSIAATVTSGCAIMLG